jgi:hypothetical protein
MIGHVKVLPQSKALRQSIGYLALSLACPKY